MLGLTISEINDMDFIEYQNWREYFRRRPYEWRNDLRSYRTIQFMSGTKLKPEEVFESIAIMKGENEKLISNQTKAAQTLKGSRIGMLLANSGISLDTGDTQ